MKVAFETKQTGKKHQLCVRADWNTNHRKRHITQEKKIFNTTQGNCLRLMELMASLHFE